MRLALSLFLLVIPVYAEGIQAGVKPTCSAEVRGLIWNVQGADGVADYQQTCLKAADNTYAWLSGSVGLPRGAVIAITAGACSIGWTEATDLAGKMLFGTIVANGDIGGTGGSDTITPSGTIAWPAGVPTFAGSQVTTGATSAGTPAGTNAASATSGNCAATNIAAGTGSTTACKATAPNLTVSAQTFTGSALGTHTHTVTASGTITWPAGVPTFTGTQFDNRSAYVKVIFCRKS